MRLPLAHPLLGTWPTIQSCALAGNRTGDPLVHRPVLNPLSYTSQGPFISSCILIHLVVLIECKTSQMKAYRNNLRPWMMLPSFREDIYLLPAGQGARAICYHCNPVPGIERAGVLVRTSLLVVHLYPYFRNGAPSSVSQAPQAVQSAAQPFRLLANSSRSGRHP